MRSSEKITIKWLFTRVGRKNWYILLLTLLNTLSGMTGVVYALLMRQMIDTAVAHDRSAFLKSTVYVLLLTAAQIVINAVLRRLGDLSRAQIENVFKKGLFSAVLNGDYPSVSALHSGEWMNRLTNDTSVIAGAYTDIVPGLAGMLMKMISALVMIVMLDYHFAYILIPGGIVISLVTYLFRKKLKALHKAIQESDGRLRVFLQESIGSLFMVKVFSAKERTAEDAAAKMEEHKAARMKRSDFSNFCSIGFGAAMSTMYLGGAVYCAYGILNGTVTYGTFVAVTQLISQVQSPFANLTSFIPRFYAMTASAERLMEAEKFEMEPQISAEQARSICGDFSENALSFGLENVSFTYPLRKDEKKPDAPVLENFSLTVKKGSCTAFTGHSGCGKSTVLRLLMDMYHPESGRCICTMKDGSTVPLDTEHRCLFAYVPQGNHLMGGTVRESVSFSDKSAAEDTDRIMHALKTACADGFVSELENGIDTVLGERGTGLSEGQAQRIAIARAVFSERPVLLLDEATSALDEATECRLLENLQKMTDKTLIIITHRPKALEICDNVVRFDGTT